MFSTNDGEDQEGAFASSSDTDQEPLYGEGNVSPGVPIEKRNPLGKEFSLLSAVMLNVGQILGSGIFSVPGAMLNTVGSVGMLLAYWVFTPIFPLGKPDITSERIERLLKFPFFLVGLSLYTEFAAMFPDRSGAEVVYLEQAYPRPRFFVSSAFAVVAILTSFSASNAIVFAQYVLSAFDVPVTASSQTFVAVAVVLVTVGSVALSTRWSLRAVNVLTTFKIGSLVFIVAAGIAMFGGLTRVENPYANFQRPLFEGTSWNLNALSTAFVKSHHSFIGWHNAFNVLGEIKSRDPVRVVRKSGYISLLLVSVLFLFINVSYVAAVPRQEILESGQLITLLFFRKVFGPNGATILPLIVASSCFGNIIAVTIGQARIIREVSRQGLLPYARFFSSTKPFETPIGPASIKGGLTVLVILILPAKDAFNFVLDLASYPNMIFQAALALGLWVLRGRRRGLGVPPVEHQYRASNPVVFLYLAFCVLLVALPWVPPEPGHADVSFWYATYCVAGIVLLLCCALYYWVWIILLPRLRGYEIVEQVEESSDGARNRRFVRQFKSGASLQPSRHNTPPISFVSGQEPSASSERSPLLGLP